MLMRQLQLLVRLQSVIKFEPCVAVRHNEMAKSCGINLCKIIVTKMQSLAILLGHACITHQCLAEEKAGECN